MEFILKSIEDAVQRQALFPAIITSLTVPDIAGSVTSPDGTATRASYIKWVDDWFISMHPSYGGRSGFDGSVLYALRCKLLHQGQSDPSKTHVAEKSTAAATKRLVAFNVGPGARFHLCTAKNPNGQTQTILRAENFCVEMVQAGRAWLTKCQQDPQTTAKLASLVDIRTEIPQLSSGIPLICAEMTLE